MFSVILGSSYADVRPECSFFSSAELELVIWCYKKVGWQMIDSWALLPVRSSEIARWEFDYTDRPKPRESLQPRFDGDTRFATVFCPAATCGIVVKIPAQT